MGVLLGTSLGRLEGGSGGGRVLGNWARRGWGRVGGPKGGGARRVIGPKGGGPEISHFFFSLPPEISFFLFYLGVFSWNFGGG